VDPRYRNLPKVDVLARDPALAGYSHGVAVAAARKAIDDTRAAIAEGPGDPPDPLALARDHARLLTGGQMRPVINATGVVIHTNLGRAPWSEEAIAAASAIARGYANVEIDLAGGRRGGRMAGIAAQLQHLVGAEAALVVNNCAAAVLLALTALARDREVVVSRGELVEIGGSFRVPDVIASGGARLREVGTTNRTRVADYLAATSDQTAAWLVVHPSNFRITGFTESPDRAELVSAARTRGVLALEDLGSGSIAGGMGEPGVRDSLAAGMDLAMFSGDKLLGGPQAGIVVGRAEVVGRLRAHPLYRALRVDKVTLAALEATLGLHADGRMPPVAAMLNTPQDVLASRAGRIAAGIPGSVTRPDRGFAGGGALPDQALPTTVVALSHPDPEVVAERLRIGATSVVARVAGGALVLDPRTVADREVEPLIAAVLSALA
jgi:L-seryl-tRNA(Ser) seleniumtransferase